MSRHKPPSIVRPSIAGRSFCKVHWLQDAGCAAVFMFTSPDGNTSSHLPSLGFRTCRNCDTLRPCQFQGQATVVEVDPPCQQRLWNTWGWARVKSTVEYGRLWWFMSGCNSMPLWPTFDRFFLDMSFPKREFWTKSQMETKRSSVAQQEKDYPVWPRRPAHFEKSSATTNKHNCLIFFFSR